MKHFFIGFLIGLIMLPFLPIIVVTFTCYTLGNCAKKVYKEGFKNEWLS